ncbi:MAG: hypothetical protein Q9M97_01315 [Candidatus Gracilibacteria bacterium]|nr:hypothetical protein [Candidatus Gracilibacteria bacterium]
MKKQESTILGKCKGTLKNISINKIFIFTGIFFLLFIFIGNIVNNILLNFTLLVVLIIIFTNFYIYIKKYFIYLLFIIIGAILGIFFSYFSNNTLLEKQTIVDPFFDIKYKITGEITGINKIKKFESEYKIKLKTIGKLNNNSYPLLGYFPLTSRKKI